MKKLIIISLIAFAAKFNKSDYHQNKQMVVKDPVCKMKINPKSKTTLNYVHEKVEYAFCSEVCKNAFLKQPNKYIKK